MAQRIIGGEQYETLLVRGDINGGPVPVAFASGVTISGVTMSAEVEVTNDTGSPIPASVATLPLPSGAATASNQDSLIATVSGINIKVPALQSGAVPVGDNGGSLTVDGKAYRSVVSFLRPDDATAYTAGDVVGTSGSAIHTLSGIGPSGGFVFVQSTSLLIGNSTVPTGMGAFRLHFYSSSPAAIADNAAFSLASGETDSYMGFIDLPSPQSLGNVLYSQTDYVGRQLKLASGQTSLFAELQTRNAYTPASGTSYQLRVSVLEAGL
jgi:hypothetical protein